jgi:putative ribosome biogenesis GTPase RsgA
MIGNKNDLSARGKVGLEKINKITEATKIPLFLTSAKTGENIKKVFSLLGQTILRSEYNV